VDLLDDKLDASRITGLLIYNAHKISETSIESFIIRVYSERNRAGFIKAFSEEPEALTNGYMKVERLLRSLYLQKLYLWPRFRLEITQAFDSTHQPEVIELSLPLTPSMLAIQNGVLVAMYTRIKKIMSYIRKFTMDIRKWLISSI
jgi:DNA excision repair protein ERCC-4